MTIEAEAILGLFFYIWSHESQHSYDKRGGLVIGVLWVVKSITSSVLLIHAFARAMGWFV